MDTGLFANQGKKLLLVAFFLVCVALLIGGEDDPGIVAQYDERGSSRPASRDQGQVYSRLPRDLPMRKERPQASDPELEAWYKETAAEAAAAPEPVDPSEGVNDTVPATSTDPVVL